MRFSETRLVKSRQAVEQAINDRIEVGRSLKVAYESGSISDRKVAAAENWKWSKYNIELLSRLFTDERFMYEYQSRYVYRPKAWDGFDNPNVHRDALISDMQNQVDILE